jgi:hypothetical protein
MRQGLASFFFTFFQSFLNPKSPAFRGETADYADVAIAADLITEIRKRRFGALLSHNTLPF